MVPLAISALVADAAACGRTSEPGDVTAKPAELILPLHFGQWAIAETITVISARVTDANGKPVAGVDVRWTSDEGSPRDTVTATDSSGLARTKWTLGTRAGAQRLQASVPGLPPVFYSAEVTPDPPAIVELGPDTLVFTALNQRRPFTLRVTDRFGNEVKESFILSWEPPAPRTSFEYEPSTGVRTMRISSDAVSGWAIARVLGASGPRSRDSIYVAVRQVLTRVVVTGSRNDVIVPGDAVQSVSWAAVDSLGSRIDTLGVRALGVSVTSSAPDVAAVDTAGRVVGLSPGTATIRVVVGALVAESKVTVVQRLDPGPIRLLTFAPLFIYATTRHFAFSNDGSAVTVDILPRAGGTAPRDNPLSWNEPTGSLRWRRTFTEGIGPIVLGRDGTAYMVEMFVDSSFVHVVASSGTLIRRIQLSACGVTPRGARSLSLTSTNRIIVALSPSTGTNCVTSFEADGSRAWEVALPARVAVVSVGPRIYAVDSSQVAALDERGTVLWQRDVPWTVATAIVDGDGTLLLGSARDGRILSLDASGTQRWTATSAEMPAMLLLNGRGDVLAFGTQTLTAISAASGSVNWTLTFPSPIGGSSGAFAVAGDNGRVYVAFGSSIYVVDDRRRELLGRTSVLSRGPELAATDGRLYIMDGWGVYVMEAGIRPAQTWSQWRGNAGRTNAFPTPP